MNGEDCREPLVDDVDDWFEVEPRFTWSSFLVWMDYADR